MPDQRESLDFEPHDLLAQRGDLLGRLARTAREVIQPRPEQLDTETGAAERSLEEFTRQAWHSVEPARLMTRGWAIGCVCAHLEAVTAGEVRGLIVNVPPGTMKSMLACVMWPSWVWVRDPGMRWIFGSYGQGLSFRDSDRMRDLIGSHWYQARWGHVYQLKRSYNTKERFGNTRQGYRISTTIAGKAMGERADYLCFPPDEVVWTDRGKLPIGDIVRGRLPVRAWSVDPETGRCGLRPVTAWHENPGSAIVEVVLSDGAAFRCTPDHKVWTVNRGWVRADGLLASDVLPGEAVPDLVDGAAADAEAGTHGSQGSFLVQDCPHEVCGELDAFSPAGFAGMCRPGNVLGSLAPHPPRADVANRAAGDAVAFRQGPGRLRAAGNVSGDGNCYLGAGSLLPDGERPVTLCVTDVLGPGAVFQVVQAAIVSNAVAVSALLPGGRRPEEGKSHALVDAQEDGLAAAPGVEVWVPVRAGRRGQDLAGECVLNPLAVDDLSGFTPRPPGGRDGIQSLESGYRSPLFVRHVGYSEKTYCVTVADYHTLLAGNGKVIVANCYDDPHKPLEVSSRALREAVIRSWTTTMSTRGSDPKTVRKVVVMQRLHERDLSGYLLAEVGGYEHLCYDRATEVLTENGWVRFDQLREGIKVAQVDPAGLGMSFVQPTRYVRYRYEGPVCRFRSDNLDLLVTPDHRMVCKTLHAWNADREEPWGFTQACALPGHVRVPQAVHWDAPDVPTVEFAGRTWDGDDFCRFMGAWLAEGCTRKGRRDVVLGQDAGPFHDELWALLGRVPCYFWRSPQGRKRPRHAHFVSCDRGLFEALRPFGKSRDKYVPAAIKAMSARQIALFLEWYGKGDGHRTRRNRLAVLYTSKSARLMDDVQELLLRVGRTGGLQYRKDGTFRVQERVSRSGGYKAWGMIGPQHKAVEPFADDVFCVSVPSGAILVRRNGKPVVCGNCLPMEYEPARYFLPFGTPAPAGDGADARGARPRDAIVPTSVQRARPELMDGPTGSGRRAPGDLLWPERFGPAEVEDLKATLQGPGTAGQLQQRPAAAEGALFMGEDFRTFTLQAGAEGLEVVLGEGTPERPEPVRIPAHELRFYQCVDTALRDTETAAFTCVGTFAWHPRTRTLLVWHVWRARLEVREQMESLREMRDGQGFWDRASRRWEVPGAARPWPAPLLYQAVEAKASGIGLLQEAAAEGYPLLPLRAVQGKAQRAATAVTMLRQGRVWFRAGAPWLTDFTEELLTFPNGAYSDQADVLSYAAIQATTEVLLTAAVEGDLVTYPDPRHPSGRPLTAGEMLDPDGHREVLNVAGQDVEFNDDPESLWLEG